MRLSAFTNAVAPRPAFILRGYAGTGKTSLVAAYVQALVQTHCPVTLLAPTGRAAKVLAAYAKMPAYTIHKAIYRQHTFQGEDTHFELGFNAHSGTVFIVDEASMIARGSGFDNRFGTGRLLDDLIEFVYSKPACRLLLVGDTAQLPPVGEAASPALSAEVMRGYGLAVTEIELTEVVRQAEASSVLAAATAIREQLATGDTRRPRITANRRGEVRYLPGDELIEQLTSDYSNFGIDETIVVTRSNRRANLYNEGIRARIFDRESTLTRGDLIMVVKNNYFWAQKAQKENGDNIPMPFDFVANGDSAEVVALTGMHEQYGFTFADATLRFPDYNGFELDCRVLLDTLHSESPALTEEQANNLYEQILADYADIPSKKERMKALRTDAYYNALQIKYAYAVTCHKAQGGQWARVYIDQGYVPAETDPTDYLRWLYTALTRTSERVYLVNFPREQTNEEEA